MIPAHFIEVTCEDGTRVRIRSDEVVSVIERPAKSGRVCVTIPLKAKTLLTVHTMDEFFKTLSECAAQVIMHKIEAPPIDFSKDPPAPIARARRTA